MTASPLSSPAPLGRACAHEPACPAADASDHEAAIPVAVHPEQGWSLLCNGVVLFEDTGELLPDGRVIGPRRPTDAPPVQAPAAGGLPAGGAALLVR
ncbi:DUF5999 family protein [Actinospica durhamensis]|uniref:DUF5999 family protein n=1 Tax=Actinospica durhamensis TaxID=1508375 RepID=UPI0027DB0391|nr:DUF5999 family protein [Actinospica durhamensis]